MTKLKSLMKNLWNKTDFKLFAFVFASLLIIYIIPFILFQRPGVDFSDGTVQYRIYIKSFYDAIKSNNLSSFDMNNYYGTSWFSLAYYVPLDIFSLIMFLLSCFVEFNALYSFMRLFMLLCGVMMFYYMSKKTLNFTEKVSFYLSLLYMVGGALTIYNCYFTYIGMFFYIPLIFYTLDLSHKKKIHHPLMITVFFAMLFNFYLGYMMVVSSVVAYFIIDAYRFVPSKENLKNWLKKELIIYLKDGLFVLIGVLSSSFILVPSICYLLSIKMNSRSFVFSFKMLLNLFINTFTPTEEGLSMAFLSENYISYQRSLYLTTIGFLFFLNFILVNKKDKKKNLITLLVLLALIIVPIFSFVFCGVLTNYGRWYFLIELVLLYMIGLNIENDSFNLSWFDNKKKYFLPMIPFALTVVIILIIYLLGDALLNTLSFKVVFALLSITLVFYFLKFPKIRKKLFFVEILIALFFSFRITLFGGSNYLQNEKEIISKIDSFDIENNDNSLHRSFYYSMNYMPNSLRNLNSSTKGFTNDSIMFSSFYNSNINQYRINYEEKNITLKEENLNWYHRNTLESSIYSSSFFGYKYYIVAKTKDYDTKVPNEFKLIKEDNNHYYYKNPYETGFASVYYSSHNNFSNSPLLNTYTLSSSCYYENSKKSYNYSKDFNTYKLYKKDLAVTDMKFNDDDYLLYSISNSYFKEGKRYYSPYGILLTEDENNHYSTYLDNSFVYSKEIKNVYFMIFKDLVSNCSYFYLEEAYNEVPKNEIEQIDVLYNKDTFF